MATSQYRIVSGAESEIHDEPHLPDSRITVREVRGRVEDRGLAPETVADRFNLNIAAVYEALAYYHSNLEEMRRVERRHTSADEQSKRRSSLQPPADE